MTAPYLRERALSPVPEREARHPAPGRRAVPPAWDERLSAARTGDEQALREIYRDAQPRLLRYLRTLVGDEADDVASETWLRIARDLPGFTGNYAGFKAWGATIARHRAVDHLRREGRRPGSVTPLEDAPEIPGPDDTASQALDSAATRAAVAMLAALPRDQAEAVLLRAVMGLDAATAGHVLGKRPGAVRTAAHRGLRRLAALIAEPRPAPDSNPGVTPAEPAAVKNPR